VKKSEKVWLDGQLVPWNEATVHVASHAIHYGSSVFEGIRAYSLPAGPAVFCLDAHLDRLWNSCKVYRMEIPYARDDVKRAIMETIIANEYTSCYIRPVVFRGWETLAVNGRSCPTHVSVITVEMGKYLGADALENGVDAGVSTWRRMAPDTHPAAAKIGGQYINSQFIAMEAADHGYSEGIALDINGYVSEGSGENVFIVKRGDLYTPLLANSILDGITRRCVMTLAGNLGIPVHEASLPREALYLADEAFFCGTAAEITPIRSVDGVVLGRGKRGSVTTRLMEEFFGIVEGKAPDRHGWLTPVKG
jgi:branched-chain amino acid aminotransferase